MTDNHLLLYRLAELMLEHEQQMLPVDLLFDDEQIGDFVKSIQIDSPYQQMLLEGVLTETVLDEKLYISYTVEGYYYYVLGEVVGALWERIGVDNIIELIQNQSHKHLDNGLSQFLLNQVNIGNYEVIFQLLDRNFQKHLLLTPAVIQTLLIQYDNKKIFCYKNELLWDSVFKKLISIGKYSLIEKCLVRLKFSYTKKILRTYLIQYIPNKILESFLEETDSHQFKLVACFYLGRYKDVMDIYDSSKADSKFITKNFLVVASAMIDSDDFAHALELIKKYGKTYGDTIEKLRLESIAYNGLKMNVEALASISISISKSLELNGSYHLKTAELLNIKGLFLIVNGDLDSAYDIFEKSGDIFKKTKGKNSFEFAVSIGNRALVYYYSGNINYAVKKWDLAISILNIIGMSNHPETAGMHRNIAFCHSKLGATDFARNQFKIAYDIYNANGLSESAAALNCLDSLNNLETNDN